MKPIERVLPPWSIWRLAARPNSARLQSPKSPCGDAMMAAGATPITLGGLTLRADAVPVVAIAVVRFALDDL